MRGKVALVTGAAGGIGAEVVRALSEQGVAVAAVDREAERLEKVVADIRRDLDSAGTASAAADDAPIEAFAADVADPDSVERTVEAVERRLGPLDFLVNAAGVLRLGEACKLTDADWTETIAVNTTGVFLMSRAVVNRMIQRSRGAIVTVGSNAAGTARWEMAAYAASKAASTMFTKCLGLEVARYGIRCNVVAPGSTDTPMLSSMWRDETGPQGTINGQLKSYRVGIPLGKLATPVDVAQSVVFLLSDQASHITMQHLTVDGGATLGV